MRYREFSIILESFIIDAPTGRVGPEIADIQKALVALGYSLPKYGVDGILGPETRAAVQKFQVDNKLISDGDPGEQTVKALNSVLAARPEIIKTLKKSTDADVKSSVPSRNLSSFKPDVRKGMGQTAAAKEAFDFFVGKGWSPEQSAGIVGNLQAESGANLNIKAVGDGGQAYGVAQWHPPRQQQFSKVFKKDIRRSDLKDQLAFVDWELNNTEASAGRRLRKARTAEEAAWIVDEYYERSSGAHRERRMNNALSLMKTTDTVA